MVKLIFLCRRRPDITHERYVELLLQGHVPIALQHHPMLRKYVVNIVEHVRQGAPALDSIGELTFDSLDDYRQRLYDSPAGREIVQRDVQGFLGGAHAYATTEHIQKASGGAPFLGKRSMSVKLVSPIRRRAGMSHAEFVDHWLHRHAPLALVHHTGLIKYVTNVVDQRLSDEGEDWDGIAELYFASEQELQGRMFDSPAGEQIIRADMARFIGALTAYHVAEYVER